MFSHVSNAFPSSFSEFSKSITNTIASQLNLSGNKREVPNYKADGDAHTPPTIDPDVLLSYYAHAAEHRPSSRLLKERVFDRRLKGPRSANLLVSGSPIFERPWRAPERAPGRGNKRRSSSAQSFGAPYRPKTAASLQSGKNLQDSSGNHRRSSHSLGGVSGEECVPLSAGGLQQRVKRTQRHEQAGEGSQEIAGWRSRGVPKASTRARTRSSLTATPPEVLPQIPHGDPTPVPADDHAEQGGLGEGGLGHEDCRKSDAPAAEEPTETLSERPLTAPSAVTLSPERVGQRALDCDVGVDGVADEATTEPTSGETSAASPGWGPRRSSNDGDRRSTSSTRKSIRSSDADRNDDNVGHTRPEQHARDRMTRPRTTPAVATPGVGASFRTSETILFDAQPVPPSLLSRRPSTTAPPSRRPTIETDAALSRSSLLPPASTASAPSLPFERGSAILGNSVVGGSGDSRRVGGSDNCEFSTAGRSGEDWFSSSLSGATGATWTKRWHPGDSGDLDVGSESVYGESSWQNEGAAAAWTNNGAATGAGWGGEDQMDRVAAAPKSVAAFGRRQRGILAAGGGVDEDRRPDTRERCYDAPIEVLKSFHPCVRCFDALMGHLRDGTGAEELRRRTSSGSTVAAGDPHVAFFVRWETMDRGLGRFTPRGFMGSFTPSPFRPALAEYAVKAATEDPKFWGLGWARIPDTSYLVVRPVQHERDWLSNRHGLILSFKDGAGRHCQSTLFPETIRKAGWNKERAIEAIYQKAGYWRTRKKRSENPSKPLVATPTPSERKSHMFPTPTVVVADPASGDDPVVSRTAVMLRFETVSFRMGFGKYIAKKRLKGG
ncbi:conserved unknown protein [Ectocarpus siliculosus]|uniref:AMMECR1 domain-containing protein n=1 Tax=Ectocarpus siliculosus TaxID=2880 RepID=D7FTC2_ECTSI|nr:conserved unknown protein [Ectocarpus siliculosus]|eukprot:CBJ48500.1 conserved unknown protein [Ectocarpus siliculosus]